MTHAFVLRSPVAHAHIKRIDTAAARRMPGVLFVATGEDVRGGRNSFPKTEFTIQLRLRLKDERCELQVESYRAEKTFEVTVDDASSWKAAIEHIISVLMGINELLTIAS